MRVLMVTNMFPTVKNPASGVQVKAQIEFLQKQGIDIDVLFMNVRESRLKLDYLKGIWQIFWKTLLNRYDIVHAHFGLSGLIARFQVRAPIVISFTGGDVMHPYVGKISRLISNVADASIVKSERMKEVLGNKNAHVIPNGVDFNLFKPVPKDGARRFLQLKPDKKYILFVGDKDGKVKRFDLIERAFEIMREQYGENIQLITVYRRPQEEIPIYMNACDVLILTSDWEGSPNVIKEAMACNLPIVTVDVGDARDIVNNTKNCYICERKPSEIAEGLLKVLRSNGRTDGREKIKHLSSENAAKKIIEVYRTLLDKKQKDLPW